jgi:peptidoglycan/xylan/chitin deacetylase (PgdA/CDA1 family)
MLADEFELGSHTFHHTTLTRLSQFEARREIIDGKVWLEDITGLPAQSFCYPRGKFNRQAVALVAEAGFAGARTTMLDILGPPRRPHLWGVSTHACHHSRAVHIRHAIMERNLLGLVNAIRVFRATTRWDEHFMRAAAFVAANGGVAHLWLHSWELDANGHWARLSDLLTRIRERYELISVTNGELFAKGQADVPV